MEAAVMQMQQVDEYMAGPPAHEYMSGEETDDESIDIINSTPDPKATSQQNGSAAAFSQPASEQPTDAATVKQQALPEPQQLPAPQLEQYVLSRAVQPDQEAIPDSPSETAAEVSGSASGSPQEDWLDGDAPLASMRSQDMSAPPQQPGIAARPSQQQQAESKSKGTPRKQGPPALRQNLPAPSASGALSRKRSLEQENGNRSDTPSSSDDEDAGSAPGKRHQANGAARKKRRNVLPVIRRDQRCGKCRTCLNPQMKKACLTRRAEMMKDMDKKGDLPLSLLASMKQKGGAAPQKASPPRSAEEPSSEEEEEQPKDPWQRDVEALNLSRNGGLPGPKRVPLFCKVLREADNIDKRKVALKILELSRGEALTVFTHSNNGLKILGEWISKAKASDKDELRIALQVLTLFGKLPIDIDALLVSGVAKAMRGVGKDGPQALQSPAKQLVKNWKGLLPAGPAAAAEKRPAEASGVVKQERASKAPKADPRKGPGASAPPAVAKPAAEDAKSAADVAQPPSPGAAAGAAKALLVASDFSELDMPPAIVRRVAPREAPQAAKQAPESGAAQKAPEMKAEQGASTSAAAAAAPSAAAASSANAPASSAAPKTLTPIGLPSQQRTTVTVSIGAPRPSFGSEPSVGFTETRLGGPRPLITDQRSANERAAAAAAKIPDPVEDRNTPKRVKRKSVSWAGDKSLQSVRLFSMHEPCDYVGSGEAVAHEEVLPVSEHALHASRPAGFASAARHEHEHEAAALRKLQEEVHETDVAPELEWCEPPGCVLWYDSADNPQQTVEVRMPGTNESGQAYGGGQYSQEKPVREAYGHLHPDIHFGPGGTAPKDCPEELPSAQQRPVPGQPPSVPTEVPPKPAQPQPEPEPVLPPPPAQQQPVQAPGAGIIVNGLHINPIQLQQLLASVGQGGIQLSQPQSQVPPQQQLPTQVPIQPQPSRAPFQLPVQQPPQLQPQQQPLQQQPQWNAPPQQPPQQQAPPQGQVPAPVSLPAPGGTHPLHPRRQQQNAPARKITQAPAHAQQHMGQPQPGQHSVPHSTKKPVTLKPPGLAQQPLKPVPVVLPTPGQQGLPGPPQRQSGQPQYQGRPQGQQQQSPGYQQNPRPPTLQPPAPQQPHQGQIRPGGQGRGPPPRAPPPVQHPAPGKGPRLQRPARHQPQSSALCTFFNTPKGCRKGDQCRFVHERR